MKLAKILAVLLILYSCKTPEFNFGDASAYLPSEKLLQEGIVHKYYAHQKRPSNSYISTHTAYRLYQAIEDKLIVDHYDPEEFTFKNNQMILLKEVAYWRSDTFSVNISEPIIRDWGAQKSSFQKMVDFNVGISETLKMQERNVDTTTLNKRSKLFEGKGVNTSYMKKDTFEMDIRYKEIYTENLGLTYAENEDKMNIRWMELIEQIPLKLFKKNAKHGLKRVGYINPDEAIDKNEAFEVCNKKNRIYDYYAGEPTHLYKGGKKAIWNIVKQHLNKEQLFNESGYLTFRFIVNCEGKAGWFITEEANLNFKRMRFNTETTAHFYEILQKMKDWIPTKIGDENEEVDAYFYLTFKLKNGELIEILP